MLIRFFEISQHCIQIAVPQVVHYENRIIIILIVIVDDKVRVCHIIPILSQHFLEDNCKLVLVEVFIYRVMSVLIKNLTHFGSFLFTSR